MKAFTFSIDGKTYELAEHEVTPRRLLALAGLAAEDYYLIEVHGNHQKSYKDNPEAPIHLHEHARFISIFCGGTPVSMFA